MTLFLLEEGRRLIGDLTEVSAVVLHHSAMDTWIECSFGSAE